MNKPFELEVLTRERSVLRTQVTEAVIPGVDGYFGVWAGHAPLMTALMTGVVDLTFPDGTRDHLAVTGGFVEVLPEKTTVLADAAERAEEIDRARAEAAARRAQEMLAAGTFPEVESDRARRALARALNRLEALQRR